MFTHIFGMKVEEAKTGIVRVLKMLGFRVSEMDSEILAIRMGREVRIRLRFLGRSALNIPQTEVTFEGEAEIHDEVVSSLRLLRMGG